MMKGRTTNKVQSNRSMKNVKRDQKTNGVKRSSSEQEKLKAVDTTEESNVTTQSKLSEVNEVNETTKKEEILNGSGCNLAKNDDKEEEDKKDFDVIAKEKTESAPCSEISEGTDVDKTVDVWDDASDGGVSDEDEEALKQKVENLETRMEKLEDELREVAALEISLYSVVPDHSSSAHKLHTPARRMSRLYIHACKQWSQRKQASVARNTVSGLILVAKSCGNDVSRLTFWLSNIIALREIISQVFEDLMGTKTFTATLEKVEFWVFSRIIESVWWQVFTPHMQSQENGGKTKNEKLMKPVLADHEKGSFSVSLWKNAFKVALSRLCPMRGEGHECGCLPILAKMVMEKCIARLDVAMFNAILRESEHQIPTDPVSDPILDSKVLPIPSGNLSFGSGAQLKNAIGNWSRCLAEMFDINTKSFTLLNELSDLLMLPKDILMDRSIREEVCSSISLPLIKRILCNFTPDEFCPDDVPGAVLEELNAESISEQKLSGFTFPYAASSLSYIPPSSDKVAERISEVGGNMCRLLRNVSMIQRKGYTSDEELEELDSPFASIVEKVSVLPNSTQNGKVNQQAEPIGTLVKNSRYELLREVWSL